MIVVTGGAGFIGSALVWGLNKRGIDDILIVDLPEKSSKEKNLKNLHFAEYVDNITFISKLESGMFDSEIEGIIHMGACSDTTETNSDFLIKNNYEYTKYLAEWCIKKEKRLVYASSAATYGNGMEGFLDAHSILLNLKPLNLYGHSKHLFDLWALKKGYFKQIAGLKYFNVFGPNEYHKGYMRSVVHKAFEELKSTKKIRLFKSYNPKYKNGLQMRDFLYIKDAVEMTLFVYDNPFANGIINCGTGCSRSFYDLAIAVFKSSGNEVNIEYIDMPESIRQNYQYFTQADITKLLNFKYKNKIYSLEEAVDNYINNYLLDDEPYLGISEIITKKT